MSTIEIYIDIVVCALLIAGTMLVCLQHYDILKRDKEIQYLKERMNQIEEYYDITTKLP